MSTIFLAVLFFAIAAIYASVGFGGATSYVAVLVLLQTPHVVIPIIALICNIVVVTGNSFHYIRKDWLDKTMAVKLTAVSMPMAYFAAKLPIDKQVFLIVLFFTLLLSGANMLRQFQDKTRHLHHRRLAPFTLYILSGVIGVLSGITGIGGGILLSPLLHNVRITSPERIAALTSAYIFLNSCAGLMGQLQKKQVDLEWWAYAYLPLVVLLGGQLGNFVLLRHFRHRWVVLCTACLVLLAAANIGWQIVRDATG